MKQTQLVNKSAWATLKEIVHSDPKNKNPLSDWKQGCLLAFLKQFAGKKWFGHRPFFALYKIRKMRSP